MEILIDTIVLASEQEVHRGLALLDDIERADEQLRAFILEKFKLEDVL